MHTVIETPAFLSQTSGMTEAERAALVSMIAANPEAGDMIQRSGGCRKVRFAGKGHGKSGGYRIITYYGGEAMPVFLLAAFSKGDRANLTDAEVNALRTLTGRLAAAYRK